MADGGQRLLDVIDDPRALESFLGSISDELLQSSGVHNVVEQLTNSLESEYGIDSPNDTLFDTLDSSANLTDISQSNVPFDFGDHHGLDSYTINSMGQTSSTSNTTTANMSSISGNSNTNHFDLSNSNNHQQQFHQLQMQQQQFNNNNNNATSSNSTSICDSIASSSSSTFNILSSSNSTTTVNSSNSSSTLSNNNSSSIPSSVAFSTDSVNQQQQQIYSQQSSSSTTTTLTNDQIQQLQFSSLSNNTIGQQTLISTSSTLLSSNSTISVSGGQNISSNNLSNTQIQDQSNEFQKLQQQQQSSTSSSSTNVNDTNIRQPEKTSTMPSLTGTSSPHIQIQFSASGATSNTSTASVATAIQQQPTQQTITAAQLAQLVQAQQQTILGPQIIANASGGLHLQQPAQQSFMIDSNGQLVAAPTGTNSFGTSNLAFLATSSGVQPTYAVLAQPTAQQLFSTNTITMQPQTTIQSIKNPNGSTTYFQAGTPQIIQQASNNSLLNNVGNSQAQTATIRPKAPPQLLPKPSNDASSTTNTQSNSTVLLGSNSSTNTSSSNVSTTSMSGTSLDNAGNTSGGSSAALINSISTSVAASNSSVTNVQTLASPSTTTSLTIDGFGQIVQHQGQQSVTNTGLTFTQPSFAIGPNGSAVMVSGVNNLNAMTTTPQAIVLNQFGQQMIVPAAMGQGGIQFILRQQPTQPQVLTIQSPSNIGAQQKPIVRFVSQVPQVAQNQGTLQLQQIQTPNGPQWITVRTAPAQTQIQAQTQQIPNSVPVVTQVAEPRKPTPNITVQQHPAVQQQTHQPQVQKPSLPQTPVSTAEPSSEPPKKKAKQSKKKVTIDLNDLFKKAGIESGDFEDDGFDFFGCDDLSSETNTATTQNGVQQQSQTTTTAYSTANKVNGTMNNNLPAIPSIHSLPHVRVLEPVQKTKQKKQAAPKKGKAKSQPEQLPPASPVKSSPQPSITLSKPPIVPLDNLPPLKEPPRIDLSRPAYDYVGKTTKKKNKGKGLLETPPTPPSSAETSPTTKKKKYPKKSKEPAQTSTANISVNTTPTQAPPPIILYPSASSATSTSVSTTVSTPISNMSTPVPSTQISSGPIIQTISLTPQNQELLRNIQIHINKLVALPSRNETQETALQKLRVLQAQVIATGVTVPNPPQVQTLGAAAQGTVSGVGSSISSSSSASSPVIVSSTTGSTSLTPSSSTSTNNTTIIKQNSTNPAAAVHRVYVNNAKSNNNRTSQPPPLILNNKVVKSAATPVNTNLTTTSVLASNNNNNNAGQILNTDNSNNNVSNSLVALTTDPTTKRAIIISLTNNNANNGMPSTTRINDASNKSSPDTTATSTNSAAILNDKVTSSTGKTPTTTTISTTNGSIHYNNHQYHQHPALIRTTTFIDEKRAEELRLAKLRQEEEAKKKWKKDQIEKRLKEDQEKFVNPDTNTPFESMEDMVQRLSRYHIAREKTEMKFEAFDEDFGETACHFIDKFHGMLGKYKMLLLKESMREVPCSEHVMLERIFVNEERASLEHDRNLVSEGAILDLPSPPPSWIPQIEEYVETELKEMERDSIVNQQVQSAIDSIITFGNNDSSYVLPEESDKVEVDAFGVPISSSGYNSGLNSSSADIDEAVRSILV